MSYSIKILAANTESLKKMDECYSVMEAYLQDPHAKHTEGWVIHTQWKFFLKPSITNINP